MFNIYSLSITQKGRIFFRFACSWEQSGLEKEPTREVVGIPLLQIICGHILFSHPKFVDPFNLLVAVPCTFLLLNILSYFGVFEQPNIYLISQSALKFSCISTWLFKSSILSILSLKTFNLIQYTTSVKIWHSILTSVRIWHSILTNVTEFSLKLD